MTVIPSSIVRTTLCLSAISSLALGCSSTSADSAPTDAAHSTVNATTSAGPPRNLQGRIEKQFGEPAGVVAKDSGEPAITFVVDNPRIQPDCTGFWQFTPNGVYLIMDVSVETSEDYATARTGSAGYSVSQTFDRNLNGWAWKAIGPDGNVVADLVSTAALNCDENQTDVFKDPFSPTSTYQGSYVLDVPAGTTSVFIEFPGKDLGWEWQLPANLTAPDATGGPEGF